jgi:tetrapyrrole methylase family protein/MazG family protein
MIKQQEKARTAASLLDDIPLTLPALARSQKIQQRVRQVGFDWPDIEGVFAKLDEEIGELRAAHSPTEQTAELGDMLFVIVNIASWLGIDAESAMREANGRFDGRFRQVEELAQARQLNLGEMDIEALEKLWQEAKRILAKSDAVA